MTAPFVAFDFAGSRRYNNPMEVRRMRPNRAGLWRVIYIARGERQAQQIEELLKQAGFLVDRKRYPADGAQPEDIEIKALDAEAEEARLFLMEQGL